MASGRRRRAARQASLAVVWELVERAAPFGVLENEVDVGCRFSDDEDLI